MLPAPSAAEVCKGLGEPLADMIVIVITRQRHSAIGQIPDQLRNGRHNILAAVDQSIGLRQITGPGQGHIRLIGGEAEGLLVGKLRLIGENGRYSLVKIIGDHPVIAFVGDVDEPLHSLLVQGIDIGLVVVPAAFRGLLHISVPLFKFCFLILADLLGREQITFPIQLHIIASQQPTVFRAAGPGGGVLGLLHSGFLGIGSGCKQQMGCPELLVLGHQAAGSAGGPAILVIEPGQHFFLFALFHTGLDQIHVLIA